MLVEAITTKVVCVVYTVDYVCVYTWCVYLVYLLQKVPSPSQSYLFCVQATRKILQIYLLLIFIYFRLSNYVIIYNHNIINYLNIT